MIHAVIQDFVHPLAEAANGLKFAVCFQRAQQFNHLRGTDLIDRYGTDERKHIHLEGAPRIFSIFLSHAMAFQIQPLGGHVFKGVLAGHLFSLGNGDLFFSVELGINP